MITHSTTLHRLYLMSLMASALRQPDGQMLPMVVVCYLIGSPYAEGGMR